MKRSPEIYNHNHERRNKAHFIAGSRALQNEVMKAQHWNGSSSEGMLLNKSALGKMR